MKVSQNDITTALKYSIYFTQFVQHNSVILYTPDDALVVQKILSILKHDALMLEVM